MLNTLPKHQKVKSFFPKSSYFRCHGSTLFCVCVCLRAFCCCYCCFAFFCRRLCAICLFVSNECRKVKFNIIIVIIISSISCFVSQMFVSLPTSFCIFIPPPLYFLAAAFFCLRLAVGFTNSAHSEN